MFKKITSITTAVILASAFAIGSSTSASATGETISLGSISSNPVAGTASTKNISVTTTNVGGGTPLTLQWVTDSSGTSNTTTPTGLSTNFAVVSGNVATIILTVANTAAAGTYYLKATPSGATASAVVTVTIDAAAPSNQSSGSQSDNAAAAARAVAEQVAKAKNSLVDTLKAGKPITANDLNAADISVISTNAATRVNEKIQALPAEKRSDLSVIKSLVQRENFVDKISTATLQEHVNALDLVHTNLVPADYKFKNAVLRALIAAGPTSLTSIEQVEAAVKEAQAAVQARKARLAAAIAKVSGNK